MSFSRARASHLGIDAVELKKARRFYRDHASRLKNFFSANEISFISKKKSKPEALALILAAKEAVFKAIGDAWMGPAGFQNIEVVHDNGRLGFENCRFSIMRRKDLVIVQCRGEA